jgi:DNA gyrase subunit A
VCFAAIPHHPFPAAGKSIGKLRDNDALEEVMTLMAHDTLLFLSARGRAHSVKAYKVPEASRAASGSAISQVRF